MSRAVFWTWYWAGFAVLVLATALATIGLLDVNRDAYHDWVNFDTQGNEQQYEELRVSAAMMYTSGHAVGQLCAALFGVFLGATAARRATRWNISIAISAGAVLALVSLVLALPRAKAKVGDLWMIDELISRDFGFHSDLLRNSGVAAFMMAGLVALPLWTILGLGAGLRWRPVVAVLVLLAWFPVSMVAGFVSGGVANGVLPLYSNLGLAQLTVKFPWAAAVVTLVLAAWAVGFYRIGSAATRRKLEPATTSRSEPETA
jgi:hypothetical protein